MPTPHKYLRPGDLARLRHVEFGPRRPMEGLYSGRHVSPQLGQSVEFTDYRPYMPGDEPAAIDWKAYARSDRLIVKRFEHQSQMSIHILLDASASMAYRGLDGDVRSESKYDYGARLAAAIAFLVVRQQDRGAFGVARHGLRHVHPPGATRPHLSGLLGAMEKVIPGGEAELAEALRRYLPHTARRGMLVLISDLLDEPGPILHALAPYTARGGEVVVFHVMHEDELRLPPLDAAVITDSESGARLALNVADARPAYEKRVASFLDQWSAAFKGRGIDYNLAPTGRDYAKALERYLYR